MSDAGWGEEMTNPDIEWRMSAALENVPRGDLDLAEVTNLAGAVRAWAALDPEHRRAATLKPERAIVVDGVSHTSFTSDGIAMLSERLPPHHRED